MVIDSTHNTSQYGCKLITISVVVPSNNRGYPTVFCISSRENAKALAALWQSLIVWCSFLFKLQFTDIIAEKIPELYAKNSVAR